QLTMRTFHIGGTGNVQVQADKHKSKKAGIAKLERITVVTNEQGEKVALARRGLISILNPKGHPLEEFAVPNGAVLMVQDGQEVKPGELLCKWDPYRTPILAERGG